MAWAKRGLKKTGRRKAGRGARRGKRSNRGSIHYFTEMFSLGPLPVSSSGGSGYDVGVKMTDLPQITEYTALFTQYKILSSKLVIIPRYTATDSVLAASSTASFYNPRIVYAVQDSSDYNPPTTEADVFACNGAKVRTLNRPITINYRPVPRLEQTDGTSGAPVGVGAKSQWINFDGHGADILHYGVNMWVTVPNNLPTPITLSAGDMYAYIRFAVRDAR